MGIDEGIMLAPLDPAFRPTFEMFRSMCDFLVSTGLSQASFLTNPHRATEKFLRIEELHLFPKTFKQKNPNQLSQIDLNLYRRVLDFDALDDSYLDKDGLRGEREFLPFNVFPFNEPENTDLQVNRFELDRLRTLFDERHYFRLAIPLGRVVK